MGGAFSLEDRSGRFWRTFRSTLLLTTNHVKSRLLAAAARVKREVNEEEDQ
jgi:hypothetical protein